MVSARYCVYSMDMTSTDIHASPRLIPIASVLSPSSLTSEVSELAWHSQCEVPTLDFARENNYDYRTVTEFFGSSLAFYNHTNPKDTTTDLSYDMPSFINQRLSSQSIFNQGATGPVDSPCRSINCTYSIIFDGPGYKCERIEDGDELYARAPFKRSKLAPDGDLFYLSDVDQGDFKKPNLRPTDPTLDPNWIVGTFHFEPELWLGYTVNTTERVENDNPWKERVNGTLVNRWTHKLEAIMFHCEHYHVNYEVKVFYINGVQHVNVTRVYYLEPVMTTKYGEKPEPRRFMRPGEKGYKLMAVYHALGAQMRSYLRGYIKYANNRPKATPPVTTTQLSMTNIVDQRTAFPKNDLDHRVQKFYEDIIFTLWSTPELVVGKKENVTCVLTRYENLFFYHSRNLWTGYSVVIIITLIAIGVGTLSLRTNGIACDTLFSRIMVTTRNPTLDHLSRGACLGADPFPKEIERTRLRFGVLKERESEAVGMTGLGLTTIGMSSSGRKPEHCSFGTADETTEIVNGRLYAGLSYIKGEKEGYGAYTGHLDHRQGGIVDEKSENINDEDEGCYSSCDEGLGKEAEEIPLLRL